jgi:hypothetical protein
MQRVLNFYNLNCLKKASEFSIETYFLKIQDKSRYTYRSVKLGSGIEFVLDEVQCRVFVSTVAYSAIP